MKKVMGVMSIMFSVLLLMACGASEETKTYELDEDGFATTITFTHKGDELIKFTSQIAMQYDSIGLESKEEAQEVFAFEDFEEEEMAGITQDSEFTDLEYIDNTTIILNETDSDDVKYLLEPFIVIDAKNKFDLDKTTKAFEDAEFKAVK